MPGGRRRRRSLSGKENVRSVDDKKVKKRRTATKIDIECGLYSDRGRRDYQEDRALILNPFECVSEQVQGPVTLLGVYDGHGGFGCSDFVKKRLPKELKSDLGTGMNPVAALVNSHLATEVAFLRQENPKQRSGSTAVTVMIDQGTKKSWVAHVGDSRALLIRKKGAAVRLTKDHDAKNKGELRRIKAVGGMVDENGYVNGIVQTARAMGDYDAKVLEHEGEEPVFSAAIMPIPEVSSFKLDTKTDLCIVVACDGLFESHGGSVSWINQMVCIFVCSFLASYFSTLSLSLSLSLTASLSITHTHTHTIGT